MINLILVTFFATRWVPDPCPDHMAGCAVMQYRQENYTGRKLFVEDKAVDEFCKANKCKSFAVVDIDWLNQQLSPERSGIIFAN